MKKFLLAFALGAAMLAPPAATAQIRTVLVSPVPGNPVASGTALLAALAGIPAPSATDPWLLKIEPGIYDLGANRLTMRPWVDIEGSGIGVTIIAGLPDTSGNLIGVVDGASNAELRQLTVTVAGSTGSAVAMSSYLASPRITGVRLEATGTGIGAWGLRVGAAAPVVEDIEAVVSGTNAYGISNLICNGALVSYSLRRVRLTVTGSGGGEAIGIRNVDGTTVAEVRDSEIFVSGGASNSGIWSDIAGCVVLPAGFTLNVSNTEIDSAFGTNAYGIWNDTSGFQLRVETSNLRAAQAVTLNHGIRSTGIVRVTDSEVQGLTSSIEAPAALVQVGSTRLIGTVNGLPEICAGVYNQPFTFFPGPVCP